jgi:hypothetical protein
LSLADEEPIGVAARALPVRSLHLKATEQPNLFVLTLDAKPRILDILNENDFHLLCWRT